MEKRWFVIGWNQHNDLGLDPLHYPNPLPLTPLPHITPTASSVHSGYGFSIFSNDNLSRLWSVGNNRYGQCCVNKTSREIKQLTEITYFKRNGIKLQRIAVNPMTLAVFFISEKGTLYGAGKNKLLGTDGEDEVVREPVLIDSLQNVIDVTSSWYNYSVAVCVAAADNPPAIIQALNQWTKNNGIDFPLDISKEIVGFMASTKIYCTRLSGGGWMELEPFADAQSTIVRAVMNGEDKVIFLDGDDNVWQMRKPPYHESHTCEHMRYFNQKGIRIKDIQCGQHLILVLTEDGDVYSWGLNIYAQSGRDVKQLGWVSVDNGEDGMFIVGGLMKVNPHRIQLPKSDGMAIGIRCGWVHSCLVTNKGVHYMFGINANGECLVSIQKTKYTNHLVQHHRLTPELWRNCVIHMVIGVYPGFKNTKVLCEVLPNSSMFHHQETDAIGSLNRF